VKEHIPNSGPPPINLIGIAAEYNPLEYNMQGITLDQLPIHNGHMLNLLTTEPINPVDPNRRLPEAVIVVKRA